MVTHRQSLQATKVDRICSLLERHYPDAECALKHKGPFQLLVATILSAQCTDVRVNKVTPALFRKFSSVKAFAEANLKEIEEAIHSTGFYRNKAKNIKACAQQLRRCFRGQVPKRLDELVQLPGVGRKTAHVVLGTAFGIPSGVVVDTHVARLSKRLGIAQGKGPVPIEMELRGLLPQKKWILFSHWLILHGRQICKSRKPRCHQCFLKGECSQIGVS